MRWQTRWPLQLVAEKESSWELSSHCKHRTQLYHTLLHYKFRLMLKIRERIEKHCQNVARNRDKSDAVEEMHKIVQQLEEDRSFLQIEVKY